jgi:hypothetical protein
LHFPFGEKLAIAGQRGEDLPVIRAQFCGDRQTPREADQAVELTVHVDSVESLLREILESGDTHDDGFVPPP